MRYTASPRDSHTERNAGRHTATRLEELGELRHINPTRGPETLEQCVVRSLDQYFVNLDGAQPHALHDMVMQAVERPLIRYALQHCDGNQSAAAQLLGINRNTLRKKISDYGLA